MKIEVYYAIILTAVLSACGAGSGPPLATPGSAAALNAALRSARNVASFPATAGYKSLYSFRGGADGWYPYADLLDVNGELYGTTYYGGQSNYGTVFKVSTSGAEQTLYSFKGGADGAYPLAGLIDVNGTLYGTTSQGGRGLCGGPGCGTVFSITTSGTERVLHSFKGYPNDGSSPEAGLIDVNGTLYGTTYEDGGHYQIYGCVFAVSTSGKERVLYTFKDQPDGAYPQAGLIHSKGALYGTTRGGGAEGWGSLFEVSTSGKERILYSFFGPPDGAWPQAGLIDVGGALYGTTLEGGASNDGTVFKLSASGAERVLHSFKGVPDGAYPEAGLIDVNGTLYGTTAAGGINGTVFSLSTSGRERVIYRFKGGADGAFPSAGLIDVKGALFGVTSLGGGVDNDGTVFQVQP